MAGLGLLLVLRQHSVEVAYALALPPSSTSLTWGRRIGDQIGHMSKSKGQGASQSISGVDNDVAVMDDSPHGRGQRQIHWRTLDREST